MSTKSVPERIRFAVFSSVAVLCLVIVGLLVVTLFHSIDHSITKHFSGTSQVHQATPASAPSPTVTEIPQPPSAHEVALQLHCYRFHHYPVNSIQFGGSIDAGTCWKGGTKYAINTFPTTAVRDTWTRETQPFGVNPKWKTPTAVIYPSLNPSA